MLVAYSVTNKEVGYIQSINFLAGFVLLVGGGDQQKSFNVFRAIMQEISAFYTKDFPMMIGYTKVL